MTKQASNYAVVVGTATKIKKSYTQHVKAV